MATGTIGMEEGGTGDYTQDGSVDLKGNPALRSESGGWKACSFIVVYEVFERMAYHGISSNLVLYLTNKLHQGTVSSANYVTNWVGTIWMTPIFGAYVADAHLGQYWTFVISSGIHLLGMCLLTVAVSVPSLRPPSCPQTQANNLDCDKSASTLQLAVFFGALYTLAIGTGGTKPNIVTLGAGQFDETEPKEKAQKLSFFNWWMFSIFLGSLFGNSILVYVQDNVGWTLGYGLPTLGLMIALLIFFPGTPFYRHKVPSGSPLTKMARVLVASLRKWRVPLPSDPEQLYELDLDYYAKNRCFRIDSTSDLRFLNKAAVRTTGSKSPWTLCPVTQVEETKQMLRMIPIMLTTFVPCVTMAQVHTIFVKQGTTLDRHLGPNFQIPPASLSAFTTISLLISIVLYDQLLVPIMRRWTKNPRGITLLQRMGIGLFLYVIVMLIAIFAERKRLSVAREQGLVQINKQIPLTIFILLPQFVVMGIADAFLDVAKVDFFYDQAPHGMKSMGTSYSTTTLSIGNFCSSIILSTISHVTAKHGHKGWIQNNLNASHIDYYYAFFATLNFLNFIFFLVVVKCYIYKAGVSKTTESFREGPESNGIGKLQT